MMNYFYMAFLLIACNANKSTFDYYLSMFLFDYMVRINSCKGDIVFADDKIAFIEEGPRVWIGGLHFQHICNIQWAPSYIVVLGMSMEVR